MKRNSILKKWINALWGIMGVFAITIVFSIITSYEYISKSSMFFLMVMIAVIVPWNLILLRHSKKIDKGQDK
jgi:membrane protein CcdC involved in cytochrome C biogenesis